MRSGRELLLVLAVLVLAACGGGDTTAIGSDSPTDPPAAAAAEATQPPADDAAGDAADAIVAVSSTDLGDVLTDGDDMTLYLFLNDEQSESTCYDDCAENWPPLTGSVQAEEGLDAALLGTVEREDGTSQVTYNDWPLYYFAGDGGPGDTTGQGVGDVWYAVTPSGEPVGQDSADEEVSY